MDARTLRLADLEVRLFGDGPGVADERLEFDDVRVAAAFLARLMADERDAHVLRLLASELEHRPGDDLVARLAGALVAGRLVLTRPGAGRGPEIGPAGEDEERARRDDDGFAALQSGPPTHWVEIQLVGEDGEGIPGQRYRIVAPDGVEWSGYTDSLGVARINRIPGGSCQISFPDLDADAWEPL